MKPYHHLLPQQPDNINITKSMDIKLKEVTNLLNLETNMMNMNTDTIVKATTDLKVSDKIMLRYHDFIADVVSAKLSD